MQGLKAVLPLFIILTKLSKIIQCTQNLTITESWCPNAICKNSGRCKPCDKQFLFILAQGRSGSTTLKNMINLLPGVRIGGEIGDTIEKMENLWSYLLEDEQLLVNARGSPNERFGHNSFPPEHLSCAAQKFIENLNPPSEKVDTDTIIGFKELRIDTLRQIEFLLTHFPCSKFIFNVRNDPLSLKYSQKKWLGNEDLVAKSEKVPLVHRYLKQRLGSNRVYFMDMIEWSKSEGKDFNTLANWLGFENCIFPDVLHDNIVVENKWLMDENRISLNEECRRKQFS